MDWSGLRKYPDLKGCVGGGATMREAIEEAEENRKVYLEALRSRDSMPPERTKRSI